MDADARSAGPTIALFALAVTLGGANFIGVRFSNRELEPFWGAGLRFSLAAVLLIIIAAFLKLSAPKGGHLGMTILYGLLSFAVSYALMYWALVRVTAGVATVILAIVPLVTLLLAAAHGMEQLGVRPLVGSLLAVGGIFWMAVGPQEIHLPFTSLLAMLVAATSFGEGVIISKKVSGHHPVMTNAVGMTTGALALLGISVVAGEQWVIPGETEVIWSVAYLATFGSVGLFLLLLLVIRQWTASASSYAFVLFPLVTMLLGAWLADEPITFRGVTGAIVVMSGVWFGALSPGARRTPLPEPHPAA